MPPEVCCARNAGGGGQQLSCVTTGTCNGTSIACGKTSDCNGGEVCCGVFEQNAGYRALSCVMGAACVTVVPNTTAVRICELGSTNECPAGQKCVASQSLQGFAICQKD